MITLTGLNGREFTLNSDLIVRAQATPDTVLTLLDGTKLIVAEDAETVTRRMREFRASVLALSALLEVSLPEDPPVLRLLPAPAASGDGLDTEDGQPR